MPIEQQYKMNHPTSSALYERARTHFPSGVTHDGRWMQPFPLAVERAAGAYKWDADGNRLIDYWQGHGSLLLGHAHPALVEATRRQVECGTHYGSNHRLEIGWAEAVKACVPWIEQLRFTASGTEATMLALRLARAYTGRPTVIRFAGHFHGWNDLVTADMPGAQPPGVLPAVVDGLQVLPSSLPALEQALQRDDIAAVLLEPSGASYGTQPLPDSFVRRVRELTFERDVLLICDEVVTGFRVAPGGVQQRAGVEADLTTWAKILAGGLPGGAVGGREPILRRLAFGDEAWNARHKVVHQGTYNANPLSAAAGTAMLELVSDGQPQRRASELAARLIRGWNDVLRRRDVRSSAAYGDASLVHLLSWAQGDWAPGELPDDVQLAELKRGGEPRRGALLRMALLNHGVDLLRGKSAFVSAIHSEADIDATVAALDAALADVDADSSH